MRYILSAKNRPVLKQFASGKVLAAFDFDGTLAPIVSHPDQAAPRPATLRLLRNLTALYPCVIVSGRSRKDVLRKLRGIRFREIIGNHGIEPWHSSAAMARTVRRWIPLLESGLREFHGVVLENKRFSLTIHYRNAQAAKKKVVQAITGIARTLPGAKLLGGKQVVNIFPEGAPGKGLAVARARKELKCDKVIYVGDEKTDEAVFALAPRGRTLGIRVGPSKSSCARFYLRGQREIDRLLRAMIELRTTQTDGGK